MAGTWKSQNKVIPDAYINIITDVPLSITPGERGIVLIPQELSVGTAGEIITVTSTEANWPEGAIAADKKLANLALLGAQTVKMYVLPAGHDDDDIEDMLEKLKTEDFNVLCYPYEKSSTASSTAKQTIATWIKAMQDDEGANITGVLANYKGDSDYLIDNTQKIILSDLSELTADEVTAWIAGVTAGANITESNTSRRFEGAVDVSPRLTRTAMETAIKAGEFIFSVDKAQNVTVVADVNSLTTTTQDKGDIMKQNRSVRTAYGIREDISNVWNSNIKGKYNNNADGRSIFKAALVDYFTELERREAIQNFDADQVSVEAGDAINAVVVNCAVQLVGSMEIAYVTVYLS